MSYRLDGCWAKVERAKEHRDALDTYIRETLAVEANRPRLGTKFEPQTGEYILYVNHMPNLDSFFRRVSVMLGDVIHNLRSALDHLTFQLALSNTNGNVRRPQRVQFPITDTPARFSEAERDSLQEVAPRHRAIIERFQGYHRIHEEVAVGLYFHPLVMLRDLSNEDKHRLLPTVMIPSTGIEMPATMADAFFIFSVGWLHQMIGLAVVEATPVELGTEISRARPTSGTLMQEVEMAGYILPEVALPEGRTVVPVIDKIAAVVAKVVGEFDPLP